MFERETLKQLALVFTEFRRTYSMFPTESVVQLVRYLLTTRLLEFQLYISCPL